MAVVRVMLHIEHTLMAMIHAVVSGERHNVVPTHPTPAAAIASRMRIQVSEGGGGVEGGRGGGGAGGGAVSLALSIRLLREADAWSSGESGGLYRDEATCGTEGGLGGEKAVEPSRLDERDGAEK
eukprot:Sspe_Gene.59070::Locus_32434_Transcript_1_1_Confidence_1.000_Length_1366::g.59070::m.59070